MSYILIQSVIVIVNALI